MSKSIEMMSLPKSGTKSFPTSPRPHGFDEFAISYSLAVCSPAWPASALPTGIHLQTPESHLSTGFFGKLSKLDSKARTRQNINSGVGQIRVSKWARPEYQTHRSTVISAAGISQSPLHVFDRVM